MRPPAGIQPLEGAATKNPRIARVSLQRPTIFKANSLRSYITVPSMWTSPTPPHAHVSIGSPSRATHAYPSPAPIGRGRC